MTASFVSSSNSPNQSGIILKLKNDGNDCFLFLLNFVHVSLLRVDFVHVEISTESLLRDIRRLAPEHVVDQNKISTILSTMSEEHRHWKPARSSSSSIEQDVKQKPEPVYVSEARLKLGSVIVNELLKANEEFWRDDPENFRPQVYSGTPGQRST